jgi:hypothetical protein
MLKIFQTVLLALALASSIGAQVQQPMVRLSVFANGFSVPVDIAYFPNDSRLFIVEKTGKIWILDSLGTKQTEPFLNIVATVSSIDERGLLGLAFHPNFMQNGYFYIHYNQLNGNSRIARFTVTDPAASPMVADPNSESILLEIPQPSFYNHKGGCLRFGFDGYLYTSLGDGGGSDPFNNSQNKNLLLGKILRIDVDNPSNGLSYGIPADNPFVGQPLAGATAPILALGAAGTYSLSITLANGCVTTAGMTVSAPDLASLRWLQLSPNPSKGLFFMKATFDHSEGIQLQVRDQQGKLMLQKMLSGQHITHTIDLSGRPAGIYSLVLSGQYGSVVRQLIIE